ncbi:rust resistance kinase Lr10-like [Salvia miltiorrhiza]|uniref:rust resistance kinase Lr10-like n=1 Tax=Salvia miltiorrhiza TaxID=226208 RepID=UPI0025ABEF2B|nr:rust resistance kinase Lr10-like [Salvia miltiorrhiza]
MILFLIFLLICSVNLEEARFAAGQGECVATSCSPSGPIIRFPFRLKGRQPESCGYPGFELSCNPTNNRTEFDFQFPVRPSARNVVLPLSAKATVQEIDYATQVIRISVLHGSCLPPRVPQFSSSPSPFQFYVKIMYYGAGSGYTLFNCSGPLDDPRGWALGPIACLARGNHRVYAYRSSDSVTELPLSRCVKMYNVSDVSEVLLDGLREYSVDDTYLHWPDPDCGNCEARRMYCGFNTNNQTQCFDMPKQPHQGKQGVSDNVVIAVVVVGVFTAALAFAALFYMYRAKMRKQRKERRIERFLEDYKALRPTRYTYSDIKAITDGFKHKLGQGGYGTVFKGKLSTDIPVAVKVLTNIKGDGEEFINEVGTIGKIHHVNVVRLVGYCADGYRRALVYEFLENDSLNKYISSGKQGSTVGWEKLQEIALGVARGLDYLHQGCKQRILHFDIKPHNILLDHNLNPKVADFGLAKLCSKEQSVVTMTGARGTIGYIAPEVFSRNFGKVSYKSDIYSYGMVLLDMVGGRRKFGAEAQDSGEVYFPEWMYNQLEKGEDIAIQVDKVEESEIVKRLIIVGLWCIQWYPADRPSMKLVMQMLEGENMPIMPPNPFAASNSADITSSSSTVFSSSTNIYTD